MGVCLEYSNNRSIADACAHYTELENYFKALPPAVPRVMAAPLMGRRGPLSNREKELLAQLWAEEVPLADIVLRLGRRKETVYKYVHVLGLPLRRRLAADIWTPEAEGELSRLWSEGLTCAVIAGRLEVDDSTVSRHARALGLPGRGKGRRPVVLLAGE